MSASKRSGQGRLLLNAAMIVVVFPCCAFFGLLVLGMARELSWISPGPSLLESALFWLFCLVLPAGALAVIAWKGWVKASMGIFLLAFVGVVAIHGRVDDPERRGIDLVLGLHSPVTGVDVFCNGVHLGKTPLRISREEFRQKVKPWTEPPRQERIEQGTFPGKELSSAKYAWVPYDIFEQFEQWPPDYSRSVIDDNDEAAELLQSSRYWWHFELTGHQGVTPVANFGGGGGGTSGYLEVAANPGTTYPALEPHLEILVEALRSTDYRPTSAWIAHFREHQALLFLPFHERLEQDARLRPAMEAVVRAELALPETPTPDDCDRVLGIILDRAQARGAFQIPSIESLAVDLMGETARGPVVRRFREESRVQSVWSGSGSAESWEIHSRNGRANRQLPVEYAVQRLQPPELFDWLVYLQSRRGGYLELIGSYPNEEAVRLMHSYLWDFKYKGGRPHEKEETLRVVSRIRNPGVDPLIQHFMRDEGVGPFRRQYVMEYYGSRIGARGVDQSTLAGWIFHWAPLDEAGKLELLARIDAPKTYHYVEALGATRDSVKRLALVDRLAEAVNPSLDRFLIDSYDWWRGPQGPGYDRRLTEALLKTDTAAVRAFIEERWGDHEERQELLRAAGWAESRLPHLAWMTRLMEESDDADTRREAAHLLARIDTDAAWTLLESWAEDDADERVRQAAAEQLDRRQQREAETERRLQQYADLISGKISPEDLLAPQAAWIWDGERYVPEAEPEEGAEDGQ